MSSYRLLGLRAWLIFIISFIISQNAAYASHAQSADLTYRCLGGNQYELTLSFYRDCAGVAAPGSVTIDISSITCNQSFNATLLPIAGTGQDVSPICPTMTTQCNGGTNPGVEEYVYRGTITLPANCSDWVFSFSLCCRNSAISTISNPGNENIYVQATLDNLNATCNSSPTFSNRPIPFVCVGQQYCFNHGAFDIDGDSLVYTLIPPATSATTSVTYNPPYSASQPLASNPAVTFNTQNGDICMTPTMLQVTVMSVLVQEYRNGILIGSVMRDMQIRTIPCSNNLPYVDGINGTNVYQTTGCTGAPINFTINSLDLDAAQNVTLSWNNGIPGASFTTTGGPRPVATFSWTPTNAQTGTWCFTVTVTDDNCPYFGSQTFAFCVTVNGVAVSVTSAGTNCSASNGSASASVLSGNGPYTYAWSPSGGNNANAVGLTAGPYTVNVTDASGCTGSASVMVQQGPANANVSISASNIACFGGNNGSATVTATGGQQPYQYAWSNGGNTATINNLVAAAFTVTVTTASGCVSTAIVNITQPASMLTVNATTASPIACFGNTNGSAGANVNGGVAPYQYAWTTTPAQNTMNATNLAAGSYSCTVTDAAGCVVSSSVTLTQPSAVSVSMASTTPVSCNGGSNGSATVSASGGSGGFTYSWNTTPVQFSQTAGNLIAGNYIVTVTDINGCQSTLPVSVTQPPVLSAGISSAINVSCNGGTNGQATVSVGGGTSPYSYSWSSGSGNATATTLIAGGYTVTVTDANGCATVSTVTITQPAALVANVVGADTICPGQNTVIAASATGGTGPYSYQWSQNLGSNPTQTVNPMVPTTYMVTVTDANGCASLPLLVPIDVYQLNAANLTVNGSTAVCAGVSANISATVNGNTGPLTWTWSNAAWTGNGPYSVTPNTTTTYVVTVINGCGQQASGAATVVVHPLPVLNIAPQTATACDAVTLTYADMDPNNAGSTYIWNFGDGGTGFGSGVTHTYTQSNNYTIDIQVTSPFGCAATYSTAANVTVNVSALAQFQPSETETSILEPMIQFANNSTNSAAWKWYFGDGDSSTVQAPTHIYDAKGIYNVRLIAYNQTGCNDTTDQDVEIVPEFTFFVPNAFTPNGDGKNDIFYAYGDEITEYHMNIFDRWGNLIFHSDDLTQGWNGHASQGAEPAQQDVYVYVINLLDFRGKKHQYRGNVSLLK